VPRDVDDDDALMSIPSSEYVPALTGRALRRDGKVCCPFHDDSTPSLQTYTDPARGWVCYGCNAGGSIIDLGGGLYGIVPRGRGFHEIRRKLANDLLARAVAA
jgi:hypothetical protein